MNTVETNFVKSQGLMLDANVQWRKRPADQRFESLPALLEFLKDRHSVCQERKTELRSIQAECVNDSLVVRPGSSIAPSLMPTHNGFSQLCTWVKAPARFLRRLSNGLAAKVINESAQAAYADRLASGEDGVVRTYSNSKTGQLLAVSSDTYGRIPDYRVAEVLNRARLNSDEEWFAPKDWSGNVSGLYASDRDVWMYLLNGGSLVEGPLDRDKMYSGVVLSNSETVNGSLNMMLFSFRVTCGNLMIWGVENLMKYRLIHTASAPETFEKVLAPRLNDFMKADLRASLNKMINACHAVKLDNSGGVDTVKTSAVKFAHAAGVELSDWEVESAIEHAIKEESNCDTLWHFINGLTATARDLGFGDEASNLSRRAGDIARAVVA